MIVLFQLDGLRFNGLVTKQTVRGDHLSRGTSGDVVVSKIHKPYE